MALELTQLATEMIPAIILGRGGEGIKGVQNVRLASPPSLSRFSRQCVNLYLSQPYRSPRSVKDSFMLVNERIMLMMMMMMMAKNIIV
jgi:hypothetical protein